MDKKQAAHGIEELDGLIAQINDKFRWLGDYL